MYQLCQSWYDLTVHNDECNSVCLQQLCHMSHEIDPQIRAMLAATTVKIYSRHYLYDSNIHYDQ